MSDITKLLYIGSGAVDELTVTNGTTDSSTLTFPSTLSLEGIALVPQDGIYFVSALTNSGSSTSIYEEHAGLALSFTSALATESNGTGVWSAGFGVDTVNNALYFIDNSSLYTERFGSGFSGTPTTVDLGTLGSISNSSVGPTGALVYDSVHNAVYYAGDSGGAGFTTSLGGTSGGGVKGNYIYKVTGLSGSSFTSNTQAAVVPLNDGMPVSMALDTATDTLYFTTERSVGDGSATLGLYGLSLSGSSTPFAVYTETSSTGAFGVAWNELGSLTVDSQTGEYYITALLSGGDKEIFAGNVNTPGAAPTLFLAASSTAPADLAIDGGPVLSGTSVHAIDGNTAQTTGAITTADTVTLAVTLNGNVTVSGTPALSLNDGGTATYASGSGSNVLLFTYTPTSGQNTATLAVTGLTGTVNDAFGAGFTGSIASSFPGVDVDTTPPSLTVSGTSGHALQGGGSITALSAAPVIHDSFGTGTLTGAKVVIANAQSGDVLEINGATSGSLDAGAITYNFSGGTLSLSGTASIAEYETALGEVTYQDGGTDSSTSGHPVRTLDWSVNEGALASATQTSSITINRPLTLGTGGTVTATAGGSVVLDSTAAITDLDNDPLTSATISITSGFTAGDMLNFTNQNGITGAYNSGTGELILSGSASAANYQAALDSINFSNLNADPTNGGTDTLRSISYVVGDATGASNAGSSEVVAVCYLRGTSILTAAGEQKVESLAIGDLVVARSGGLRQIKWIGRQSFDARFVRNNGEKTPVCIMAGALGGGLPLRDLFVSPGHSMLLGSTLVLARNLVNGVSITQSEMPDEIAYYQIELETHDCVLAEGSWSESYADGPGLRAQFHNAAEFWTLYPDYVTPQEVTTCLPRPLQGPALAAALAPVVAQAAEGLEPGALLGWVDRIEYGLVGGWAVDLTQPELPVLLEVLCGAEVLGTILACDPRLDLRAAGHGQGHCSFSFPSPQGLAPDAYITVRRAADGWELPLAHVLQASLKAA